MCPAGPWLTCLAAMRCTGIVWNKVWVASVSSARPSEPRALKDLVADEKHSWLKGERVYIATTAAHDCILGASVAPSASQVDLEKAYGVFASEAQAVDAEYAPETVNTDGWQATQGAWKALFTHYGDPVFLHAFLKIRDRATKTLGNAFAQVQKRVWEAYHALSKRAFSQRLRRLRAWAETALPDGVMKTVPWTCARNAISSVRAMLTQRHIAPAIWWIG